MTKTTRINGLQVMSCSASEGSVLTNFDVDKFVQIVKDAMKHAEELKRSGRTTRMLNHAVDAFTNGHQVWLIGDDNRWCNTVYAQLRNMIPGAFRFYQYRGDMINRVDIQPGPAIIIVNANMGIYAREWDWETMRLANDRTQTNTQDRIYLVDHHIIERRFARMLSELHRYDEDQNQWIVGDVQSRMPLVL